MSTEVSWEFGAIEPIEVPGVTDLEPLGEGGMGQVYRGRDATGRAVAVKVSRRTDEESLKRFAREAELLARFNAPEVVTAHTWGTTDEFAYLVCALIEGQTLDEAAADLGTKERMQLLLRTVRAVGVAHAAGVVHRDLKPANVLVDEVGGIRLIDFGVSIGLDQQRLTVTGGGLGTPAYMPPEQMVKSTPDPSADVWSLGAIGYELLARRLPYGGSTLLELAIQRDKPPPGLGGVTSAAVERVILRALSPEPRQRYANADAFADALEAAQLGGAGRGDRWALALVAPLALVTLGITVWLGARGAGRTPATAEARATEGNGVNQAAREQAPPPLRAQDAIAVWPRPWLGELSPREAEVLGLLSETQLLEESELVAGLVARGQPQACRAHGFQLLLGSDGVEQDRPRGLALLQFALQHGDLASGSYLAGLYVPEDRLPNQWRLYSVLSHRRALGLPEDLKLAAALAWLSLQATHVRRVTLTKELLEHLREAHGVRPPQTVGEAFAIVQAAFESNPRLQELQVR